jgi:16S rRNA (cytidine1402-2'-O)-methyltransferase
MPSLTRPGSTAKADETARRRDYWIDGQKLEAPRAAHGLHIVATPIGNLGDITLRALATLAGADAILAEDSRVTRKLLTRFGITAPILPYHEHNAAEMRPKVLARLKEGAALALVSDAGTPLVSDPGFKLVRAAVEEGYPVIPIPGPSAVLAGLTVAGLPTDRFFFEGFLPPRSAARRSRAEAIATVPATLVFFETGPRIAATLADLNAVFGPRPAAVARELTKTFEEVRRGSLAELAEAYSDAERPPKGEIVLLVGPPLEEEAPAGETLDDALKAALATSSLKDAVAEVAKTSGVPRREVYARALALSEARD